MRLPNSDDRKLPGQDTVQSDEQEALEQQVRAQCESQRSSFNEWALTVGEPLSTFDEIIEGQMEHIRSDYHRKRVTAELRHSSVMWDRVTTEDSASLEELLDQEPEEAALHRFLENHPQFLIQILGGGHGRFQLSKQRLGSEVVPDFLVAELSSIGLEWYAVEIESPCARVCRKDGLPAHDVNHAIGQIRDWRQWLTSNVAYARARKADYGLGLVGIDSRIPGLIIIGRRGPLPARYNEFRRQMADREHIVIHSYDWLVDVARSNRSGTLSQELKERE